MAGVTTIRCGRRIAQNSTAFADALYRARTSAIGLHYAHCAPPTYRFRRSGAIRDNSYCPMRQQRLRQLHLLPSLNGGRTRMTDAYRLPRRAGTVTWTVALTEGLDGRPFIS